MFRCRDGQCVPSEVHCDFTSQSKCEVLSFLGKKLVRDDLHSLQTFNSYNPSFNLGLLTTNY